MKSGATSRSNLRTTDNTAAGAKVPSSKHQVALLGLLCKSQQGTFGGTSFYKYYKMSLRYHLEPKYRMVSDGKTLSVFGKNPEVDYSSENQFIPVKLACKVSTDITDRGTFR